MESIKVNLKSAPEVQRVVRAAFPSYAKHNAYITDFPSCGCNINSYWDGGSRSEYVIVALDTVQRKALPTSTHPYFDVARKGVAGTETPDIAVDHVGNVTLKHLPEGFALVEAGIFCGKQATARIMLNPANITKFLPAVTA